VKELGTAGLDAESDEGTVCEQDRHVLVDADVVETVDQVTRGEVGIVGRTPQAYDEQVGQHQRLPMRPRSTSAWTCPRSAFKRVPDAWCRRSASYPCDAMREDDKRSGTLLFVQTWAEAVIRQLDRV
jgi:hypothetical protein